jgi:hypothetical protein
MLSIFFYDGPFARYFRKIDINFQVEKLNFQCADQLQNLISSSSIPLLITIKISSRSVNCILSYRVRKKYSKMSFKAPKLSFLWTKLHQKLYSFSPKQTTPTVKISDRSVQFNERKRVRKKRLQQKTSLTKVKNWPIRCLQTLTSFFSKTMSFGEKFMRIKVVERKIPHTGAALRFLLRCTVREIFSKNWNELSSWKAQLLLHGSTSKFNQLFFYTPTNHHKNFMQIGSV